MRKNLGSKTIFYPLPVLIVGSYDEKGQPDAMNAAWGGIYDDREVMLCLSREHRTSANIRERKAFTIAFANRANVERSDYVGIVSGNQVPDKVARAGLRVERSAFVDAPLFLDYPLSLECSLLSQDGEIFVGKIENVSVDERFLDESGRIRVDEMELLSFDPSTLSYRVLGKEVAPAFRIGLSLRKDRN